MPKMDASQRWKNLLLAALAFVLMIVMPTLASYVVSYIVIYGAGFVGGEPAIVRVVAFMNENMNLYSALVYLVFGVPVLFWVRGMRNRERARLRHAQLEQQFLESHDAYAEQQPFVPAAASGRQPFGPAAASGESLTDRHINAVNVGTLFFIHFNGHEIFVQDFGNFKIFKALMCHYMAPVASTVANAQKDGLVLRPCLGKRLLSPWIPVHRVFCVLEKVGACLIFQMIAQILTSFFKIASRRVVDQLPVTGKT